MPQPYPRKSIPQVRLDGAFTRPELAQLALSVIALQSQLDLSLEMIISTLLRGEMAAARMIISQMRSAGQKREALNTLARELLLEDDANLFERSVSLMDRVAKDRNALAHSLIGSDPNFPDALVLLEPRGEFAAALSEATLTAETHILERAMVAGARLWRKQDFETSLEMLSKVRGVLMKLQTLIRLVRINPGDARSTDAGHLRDLLLEQLDSL